MRNLSAAVSQHFQRRTKSSRSSLLCQQVAPALIHQAVKSGKGHPWAVWDICLLSPYLHQPSPGLLVCFSWTSVVILSWFTVSLHPFQISSIQSRNFSLMLKFRPAILVLDMSVYLLKIFFNNACKDFTCSALVYPFILAPFTEATQVTLQAPTSVPHLFP